MSAITTERRDQVLVVHLDDGKANALSFDMIDGILTAIHEAENDDQIGAVVMALMTRSVGQTGRSAMVEALVGASPVFGAPSLPRTWASTRVAP